MLLKKLLSTLFLLMSTLCFAQRSAEQQQVAQLLADAQNDIVRDTLKSRQALQQALQIATQHQFTKSTGSIYALYGELEGRASRYSNSLAYFNKALAVFQKANDTPGIANSYNNLGNTYQRLNQPKQAEANFQQAIKLYQQINDEASVGKVLMNLGILFFRQNDYKTGIDYALQSLKIREKLGNEEDLAYSYSTIGAMYLHTNKYDDAIIYLKKSLQLNEQSGNLFLIGNQKTNIGKALMAKENYAEAKKYLLEAITPSEKTGDKRNLRQVYEHLSDIAQKENNTDEAISWLNKAIDVFKDTQDAYTELALYLNKHKRNVLQKKYSEAEEDLKLAENIVQQQKMSVEMVDLKRTQVQFYATIGKADEAKKAFIEFEKYKDSTLNDVNLKQINELKTQYETEKKQSRIDFLTSQNTIQQLNLKNKTLALNASQLENQRNQLEIQNKDLDLQQKNNIIQQKELKAQNDAQQISLLNEQSIVQRLQLKTRNQTIIIVSGLLLIATVLAATGFTLYRSFRAKAKSEQEQLASNQKLLRFKEVMEAEEKERERIAKELHDGIGHLLSNAKLNISAIGEPAAENQTIIDNVMNMIDEALAETRHISHNLMPAALSELGLNAALKQLARKINDSGKVSVQLQGHDELPELPQSKAVALYRIVQETLNNMIKHANASLIGIHFTSNGPLIIMQIADNGKGFEVEKALNTDGLGWKNIYSRVDLLNGHISVQSTKGKGTQLNINFAHEQ